MSDCDSVIGDNVREELPKTSDTTVNMQLSEDKIKLDERSPTHESHHPPASNGCVTFLAPEDASFSSHDGSRRNLSGRTRIHSDGSLASSASTAATTEFGITPPDGGWGWVVVFAAFITNMIADGVTFSFGVIYVDFLQYFNESKGKTAFVGSLFMSVPLLSGPIASTLTDRYGCRKVTIAGACLASVGFILSSFSNSLEVLFFTFGIMSGFGLALCYVAAIVIVAYYFEKRRSFATGLSVSGSGIGTFLFAPFTQYLVDTYTWRGAMLILAGCFLNIVVCGALMRDLEGSTKKTRSEKSLKTSTESISQKSQATPDESRRLLHGSVHANAAAVSTASIPDDLKDCERLCNSLVHLPTFLKQGENVPKELLEKLGKHGINYEYFMMNYPHLINHSNSEHLLLLAGSQGNNGDCPNNNVLLGPTTITGLSGGGGGGGGPPNGHLNSGGGCGAGDSLQPTVGSPSTRLRGIQGTRRLSAAYFHNLRLHRRSMTHRNAMLNTHRYHIRASSCPDIYRNSMITIDHEEEDEMCYCMDDLKEAIMDMVDISYFKNVKFLIFCISNLLLYIWYDVPYVYTADNALNLKIDKDAASYLISVIGILNTVGELLFGYVGDKPWVSSMLLYSASTAMCGIGIGIVPLMHDFAGLAFASGVFGFMISANYALTSVIVVDLITLENFTKAYGLLLLVQGIANLIGPPLGGWLHDLTNSYDMSFYMAGFWVFIAGAMILVLPFWRWFVRWRDGVSSSERSDSRSSVQQDCHRNGKTNGGGGTKSASTECAVRIGLVVDTAGGGCGDGDENTISVTPKSASYESLPNLIIRYNDEKATGNETEL